MLKLKSYVFWFVTGSQHLYGEEALKKVSDDSNKMVADLNEANSLPYKVVLKPVMTTADAISKLCKEANSDEYCAGIITWMHTFSPAKMWISGLSQLNKPMLHINTQFNKNIPWDTIDMDFMNLNQSAHGDREFGFIGARMRMPRKVLVGYYKDSQLQHRMADWMRVAVAYTEGSDLKVARFGDNMRDVAVTEGDKVETQIKLGWSVSGYGVGDLVGYINKVNENDVDKLMDEYARVYDFSDEVKKEGPGRESVREQARIELGMKSFLEEGKFSAFTTTFEDLHGLKQLPGLAVQHLMAEGYGFGPEGDWKTAALVRTMKIMSYGMEKGTSLMEDYTYNFEEGNELILGSHMLEVCPSIALNRPRIEVHPLPIGGKEDPARLVFDSQEGQAVCASLIDMGNRFRLIVNDVISVKPEKTMPKLPVARVLWKPMPSLQTSAESWILAGGAHHTSFSFAVTAEQLEDWSNIVGIECLLINKDTNIHDFNNEIRWNELAWKLK